MATKKKITESAIHNEEFFDHKSLRFEVAAHFEFNEIPMVFKVHDVGKGLYNLYKKDRDVDHVFGIGFNPKTQKPQVLWTGNKPIDIDILVATDVVVAMLLQRAKEFGIDLSVLPKAGVPTRKAKKKVAVVKRKAKKR